MKSISKKISIVFSTIALMIVLGNTNLHAQQENVSFQLFYDQLAPYGEWIDDRDYGYIWLPDVGQDFQPYATNGHWVNTQYGNTWYSNYDWGWAPFHYGRWISSGYGWAWVPGYEWAPAWVSWRQGGGQYGWAPLGPGMSFSVNINIPLRNWIFVPQRYFFNSNVYRYYTPYRRYNSFYNRTTVINNVYVYNNRNYYSGPDRRSLEKTTRNRVDVRELQNSSRPGRNAINDRTVNMYRPNISSAGNTNARPTRVVSADKATTRPVANAATRTNKAVRSTNGNSTTGTVNSTRPARAQANGRTENTATRGTTTSTPQRATRPSTNATQNETRATTPTASQRPARASRTAAPQQAPAKAATPAPARTTPARTTPAPTRTAPAATKRTTTRPAASTRNTRQQTSAPKAAVQRRTAAPARSSVSNSRNTNSNSSNNARTTRPSRNN